MPNIQAIFNKYKDKEFVVLGVNIWERDQSKVKTFIQEHKITYRILLDKDNKVVVDYKINGIPTFFIIDKKGKVRHFEVGVGENTEVLENFITKLLSE
jgi:peroxiredoxin